MITHLIETAASIFQCLIGINFIVKFNRSSWTKSKFAFPAFFLVLFIVLVGDTLGAGFNTYISLSITVIYFIFAFLICKKKYVRAIVSVCIEQSAIIIISSLLYALFSAVLKDFDVLMHGSDSIRRYIYVMISNLLLFAVLRFALSIFNAKDILDIKTGLIAFIMSIVTLIGMSVPMALAQRSFSSEIQSEILILTIIFVAINLILYVMILYVQNLQKSRYELQLLQEKMKFEENRHNDAAAIWENVRKVQHDMKQHLTVMLGQLSENKSEECITYINTLLPNIDRFGKTIKSDNKVLDYLINSKLCSIEDAQIVVSGSVGDLSDIRDIDLACLMGNILDNAIEAVSGLAHKKIELLFMKQNSNRIIICKNSISKSVLAENKDLHSTKIDGESHGYGHIIINKIVEDYNGMIDYFEEDGMFGVQIILPVSK